MANYLYNGVDLPDINTVWTDKETYPYALIRHHVDADDGKALSHLWIISEPCINNPTAIAYPLTGNGKMMSFVRGRISADEWIEEWDFRSAEDTTKIVWNDNMIWSNFDILNKDGSIFLAASDPIPVTAPVIDPLSMWLGWKAGNWVARQRGKA